MANKLETVIEARDRASAVFKSVEGRVERLNSSFDRLNRFGASLGTALAAGGLVTGLKAVVGALDDLDEAAQGAGIAAAALADLRLAAAQAGVGTEQLDTAIGKLNGKLADAAGGDKNAAQLFKTLGVSVRDANGEVRAADDVLGDIANRFASWSDGARKSGLAAEIFGDKIAKKLVPFLNQGRDGIKQYAGVTDEALESSRKLQTELDKLNAEWERLKIGVASSAVPAINRLVNEFETARKKFGTGFALDFTYRFVNLSPQEVEQAIGDTGAAIAEQEKRLAAATTQWEKFKSAQDLERLQKQLETLKALDAAPRGGKSALFGSDAYGEGSKPNAPVLPKDENKKTKKDVDDLAQAYAAYVKQLDDQLAKTGELTALDRVRADIESGRLQIAIPQQQQVLEYLATEIDKRRELEGVAKRQLENQRRIDEAEREADAKLADLDRTLYGFTGQAEEDRKRALTERLEYLIQAGQVNEEQALKAVKAIAGINDEMEKTQSLAGSFAAEFRDALGDLVLEGKKAEDVLKALLKTLSTRLTDSFLTDLVGKPGSNGSSATGLIGIIGGIIGSLRGINTGSSYNNGGIGSGSYVGGYDVDPSSVSGGQVARVTNVYNIDSRTDRAQIVQDLEANRRATLAQAQDQSRRGALRLAY